MAVVYSTRLLAWAADPEPAPYIVPTGFVVILRDIDVWVGGGAMTNIQAAVNDVAKFAAWQATVESIAQTFQWRGRQVLYAGEALVISADGAMDGMASGYVLSAP